MLYTQSPTNLFLMEIEETLQMSDCSIRVVALA